MYEHVELRPITGEDKDIAVAPNAAYGTVPMNTTNHKVKHA